MPRVLINAMASTAGGGRTYLQNVLPRLAKSAPDNYSFLVLVPPEQIDDYRSAAGPRLTIEGPRVGGGLPGRWWWEQTRLRARLRKQSFDVLVSLGNFAVWRSPVPQILFNRNDLYFCQAFGRDLKARRECGMWLEHAIKSRLARYSIRQADINVAPTQAFADRIRRVGSLRQCRFEVLPFGFDDAVFRANRSPLAPESAARLPPDPDCLRLLYVSHYNYFRNFETLLRALPLIKEKVLKESGRRVQLVLTTEIERGAVYGGYDATDAAELLDRLGIRDDLVMLGSVPYRQLHRVYAACDLFVCPSYSESFGHPLLEAMASGLPVAAANLPVHREVCGDAAVYFDVFDPAELADRCARLLGDEILRRQLIDRGLAQAKKFSWDRHVQLLVGLIKEVHQLIS